MAFKRGRTSKHKSRPDAGSRKSKTEDPEEDSQQEDADKEERIDSNDTVNTQFKLNRESILEFCAEYEAERRKQSAKKLPLLLDLLDDPQLGVLNVLFPGMECPPEWIAFQKKERARMRREAAKANAEYVPVPIVRKVSAFTYDYVIKFTRELQDKHIAVIKQDLELKQFLLEYDMTLIGMLRAFFGAHDPVQVRDELTDVRLVKTENGVLADVGQYVSEIYTTLQGIQLPDDELNLVKHLLKELAKTAPHLAGAFTADPTWYPSTIKEYTEYLLEIFWNVSLSIETPLGTPPPDKPWARPTRTRVRTVHSAILRPAGVLHGHHLLRAPHKHLQRLCKSWSLVRRITSEVAAAGAAATVSSLALSGMPIQCSCG
jgi:hypothetical protein